MPSPDEHVRYQGFIARLTAQPAPDGAFVVAYTEDVTSDPDRAMAESATIALLNHPGLSDSLLDSIQSATPSDWRTAAEHLTERRLGSSGQFGFTSTSSLAA